MLYNKKTRVIYGLKVPRDLVYAVIAEVDPAGLQERAGVGRQRRARKKCICIEGNVPQYVRRKSKSIANLLKEPNAV